MTPEWVLTVSKYWGRSRQSLEESCAAAETMNQ